MPPRAKSPAKTPPKSASKKTPTKAADSLGFENSGNYWSTATDTPRSRRATASPAPKASPATAKAAKAAKGKTLPAKMMKYQEAALFVLVLVLVGGCAYFAISMK